MHGVGLKHSASTILDVGVTLAQRFLDLEKSIGWSLEVCGAHAVSVSPFSVRCRDPRHFLWAPPPPLSARVPLLFRIQSRCSSRRAVNLKHPHLGSRRAAPTNSSNHSKAPACRRRALHWPGIEKLAIHYRMLRDRCAPEAHDRPTSATVTLPNTRLFGGQKRGQPKTICFFCYTYLNFSCMVFMSASCSLAPQKRCSVCVK